MAKADRDAPLLKAIKTAGGEARFAEALGVTPQTLYQWKRVPPHRVLQVEAITGIRREELRPDLYPKNS